jgi:hypothetical protein
VNFAAWAKHTIIVHVNFTSPAIFLTYRVVAYTKYYLFRMYPFTYVSANQSVGPIYDKRLSLKAMDL